MEYFKIIYDMQKINHLIYAPCLCFEIKAEHILTNLIMVYHATAV
jgi:hypothetical protein